VVGSKFDISLYFIQCVYPFLSLCNFTVVLIPYPVPQAFPLRILRLVPRPLRNIQLRIPHLPSVSQLFRQTSAVSALSSLRTLPAPITNPLALTRREILSSLKVLKTARDDAAQKIGFLSTHAPRWDEDVSKNASEDNLQAIVTETSRIYALVCVALDIPMPIAPLPNTGANNTNNNNSATSSPAKRSRSHPSSVQSSPSSLSAAKSQPKPTAQTLLPILQDRIPSLLTNLRDPLKIHGRPSQLTRLWIPLLMLPPLIRYTSGKALDNQAWIRSQLQNARETVSGWVIQWVWEPLMDVTKTLRTGGEGLGVEPTTVDSDKAVRPLVIEQSGLSFATDSFFDAYSRLSGGCLIEGKTITTCRARP
jgi:nuclear-control-of-ATPase protein 2